MEDTSLEDFLDGDDESSEAESECSETGSDSGTPASEGESGHSKTASDAGNESSGADSESPVAVAPDGVESTDDRMDVEPADVTASWTADGACCDACGNEVKRFWTDDETAVCSDCKNWE